MHEVTATEAARKFADLLDAVEHRGERVTIVRRGRAVARIQPVATGGGAEVKAMLRRHRPDRAAGADLEEVRSLLVAEERT